MIVRIYLLCLIFTKIRTSQAFEPINLLVSDAIPKIASTLRFSEQIHSFQPVKQISINSNRLLRENQSNCSIELQLLAEEFIKGKLWALKTIDAWGKMTSGILEGNLFWIGSTYECNHPLALVNRTLVDSPYPMHSCVINYEYATGIRPIYGICLPKSCHADELLQYINQEIIPLPVGDLKINLTANNIRCIEPREYDVPAILTIILLSFIGFIVLLATFIHFLQDYRKIVHGQDIIPTGYAPIVSRTVTSGDAAVLATDDEAPILTSLNHDENDGNNDDVDLISPAHPTPLRSIAINFSHKCSLISNIFILSHDRQPKELACLNGIRVLSLFWVIVGHTVLYALAYSDNVIRVLDWSRELWFQTIIQAVFSIDSFFVLRLFLDYTNYYRNGLLTAFTFFTAKNDNEQFSIGKFLVNHYIYRYLRYTFFYALMLMIYIGLSPYLNDDGPIYPLSGSETQTCRTNWWRNLFYINNFYKTEDGCVPITWFLAVNMQFHWVAPLFLLAVLWNWIGGFVIAFSFILVDIISTAVIVSKNGYNTVPLFSVDSNQTQGYMDDVYVKPWCRIGPYAIGLLLGHYLYDLYQRKNGMTWESLLPERTNDRFHRFKQILTWSIVVTLLSLCLFGTYQDYVGHPLTNSARAAFLSLSRIGWAIGISLIIISCFLGQAGFANDFLSHRFFDVLGHLTYGAYLWHSLIIFINYFTRDKPQHLTLANMMFNCIIHILISYLFSFITFLFVEFPVIRLLKLVFKRSINQN